MDYGEYFKLAIDFHLDHRRLIQDMLECHPLAQFILLVNYSNLVSFVRIRVSKRNDVVQGMLITVGHCVEVKYGELLVPNVIYYHVSICGLLCLLKVTNYCSSNIEYN